MDNSSLQENDLFCVTPYATNNNSYWFLPEAFFIQMPVPIPSVEEASLMDQVSIGY